MAEINTVHVALTEGGAKPAVAEEPKTGVTAGEAAKTEEDKTEGAVEGASGGETGEGGDKPVSPSDLNKKPEAADLKSEQQLEAEKATGLDLTEFHEEFVGTGKLSPESYAKLAAKGISQDTANTYIRGVQAEVAERNEGLAKVVGGPENYNAIIKWGAGALTEAEKAEAVRLLSGKDAAVAQTYLAGLNARFIKENGKAPGKTSGGGSAKAEDVFTSRADQMKAMRDPRYQSDRKYRFEVEAKSIRSFKAEGAKKRAKTAAKKTARKSTTRRSAKTALGSK